MSHLTPDQKKDLYRVGIHTGKPEWKDHDWPQIVQANDGHWYGVVAGWVMRIHQDWKEGDVFSLLSRDCEWLGYGPVIDWRNSLERRQ